MGTDWPAKTWIFPPGAITCKMRRGARAGLPGTVFFLLLIAAFFDGTPARAYQVATVFDGGSISGKVFVGNAIPRVKRYRISKNHDVCGTGSRDVSIVHANTDALLNTVVYLEDIDQGKAFPAAAKKITINQLGCRFMPNLSVLANGGVMEVVNSDNVLHNIHAYELAGNTLRSVLNASQPRRGNILTKTIDMNFGNALRLLCDAHDFMRAYVFVAFNPYYAIVDEQGRYTLDNVPPGTYRLTVWHGALGKISQTVTVNANMDISVDFSY